MLDEYIPIFLLILLSIGFAIFTLIVAGLVQRGRRPPVQSGKA